MPPETLEPPVAPAAPPRRQPPPLAWYGVSWASDPVEETPKPTPPAKPPKKVKPAKSPPAVDPAAFGPDETPAQGVGVVLGRFLPPHTGHQFLIDFARGFTRDLTIVIRSTAEDPIPGERRVAWLREMFPGTKVFEVRDHHPLPPDDAANPKSVAHWASVVRSIVAKPDYLFSSEKRDATFAERLGARFVPVDPERNTVFAFGTSIRSNVFAWWELLPPCVRSHFVRRVCFVGPESSGKSTLAKELAKERQTLAVPEYARVMTDGGKADLKPEDVQRIARAQVASEDALARQANKVLYCDTGPLQLLAWSQRLFGLCPKLVSDLVDSRKYHLYVLVDARLPFTGDASRDQPEERAAFLKVCEAELTARKLPFIRVGGSEKGDRFKVVEEAVNKLLMDDRFIGPQPAAPPPLPKKK